VKRMMTPAARRAWVGWVREAFQLSTAADGPVSPVKGAGRHVAVRASACSCGARAGP
jgi:hypothetical protein